MRCISSKAGAFGSPVTDADGREVILASLGHGDFFGEMAMLDGHGRSADATVAGDSRLAVLTRENFLTFVSSDSRIVLEMLSAVTRRLRRTDDLLRHRVSRNANEEDAKHVTLADRAADKIAQFGGSWKFIVFSFSCNRLGNRQHRFASGANVRSVSIRLP